MLGVGLLILVFLYIFFEPQELLQNFLLPWKAGLLLFMMVSMVILSSSNKRKKFFELVTHPTEIVSLIRFLFFYQNAKIPQKISENELYCYQTLSKVSRSFSSVILELCPELRMPICIFYLVLRGLDTVEDDMSIPLAKKLKLLKEFASHLEEPGWNSREGCKFDDIFLNSIFF